MNVTALVIAYYGDKWLPACLDSLVQASSRRIHLLLVDNAGNSALDELRLDRFDSEIIKAPRPMGFAEANNYALGRANRLEDAVLFLNQDTISRPGWIDECIACLESDSSIGAVSPFIKTYDGNGWDPSFLACVGPDINIQDACGGRDIRGCSLDTSHAPAPALIVRTEVLRRTGPFDPVFGSYYEDYDLCLRIRQQGFRIAFACRAVIAHFSGSATDNPERERKRMRQIVRNKLLFHLRESGSARLPLLLRHVFIDLPINLIRGVRGTPSSQPPFITIMAHWDLVRIVGRLVSGRRDRSVWDKYLGEIGWPAHIPGMDARSIDQYEDAS